MRNERRILRNTAVLSAAESVGLLANLALVASFARSYGAVALGHYSTATAVGAVAAIGVTLGTQSLLIREISRSPGCARAWLGTLLPVQVLLVPVMWLVACVVSVVLIKDSGAVRLVMAVCGYQILMRFAAVLQTPLQARELMLTSASGDLAHRLLALLLMIVAIRLGADAATAALAPIAGALLLVAFAWTQGARHFGRPELRLAPVEALQLFHRAAPFLGIIVLTVVYLRGATLALSMLAGASTVGLYAIANRFMDAAAIVPTMFNASVYPALVRVTAASLGEARVLTARSVRLLLIGSIPLAALITIFASDIVRAGFGSQYIGATRALQVLAWTLPLRGVQGVLNSQLAAMDQQAALARARVIAFGSFLLASPPLILGFGLVGAATAVLLCEAAQLCLYWRLLHRASVAPALAASIVAPATASATALAAALLLTHVALSMRLTIVTAVMAVGLWAFGAIRVIDLKFLRAIVFREEGRSLE
jgi:O-antigen/teichoic acid export membrane protein